MEIQTATYTNGRFTFEVEVLSDYTWGQSEVNAIGCFPFYGGASHAIVDTKNLHNRRVETIDVELGDPADDEPLPVELLDARADYQQRAETYTMGMGA